MFSRWLILALVLVSMAAALFLGFTQAAFNDIETSQNSTATAWASSNWTPPTQAHFNTGILASVNTSASAGNVILVTSPVTVTLSPTTNTGSAWTNPTRAYDDGGTGYANIPSGAPSGNNVWGTYGFSAATNNITRVRVRYDAWTTANITFQAAGAVVNAASGNVLPTLPTGWAANDIWLCFIASLDNTVSTMNASWTSLYNTTNATTGIRNRIYWRRAVTGDSNPTVTYTGGSGISAVIVGYRGAITSGSPFDVNQGAFLKSPTSTTNNFGNGATTTVDGDTIVLLSATSGNGTSSSYTGSPTPNERVDGPGTNLRPELIIADFVQSAAGAIGSHNSTLTASRTNTGYQLSLKPEVAQIRVGVSWDGGTSWSSNATTTTSTTETTYWYDVTAATTWTPAKLADGQLQIRVDAQTIGTACTVNLDWLPVEVTYQQYVSSGTIASQVWNTNDPGSPWDGLFWDNSLPAGTNITFEVRSRDTSFTAGAGVPAWVPIPGSGNGTANVISGLPAGRYKQWRATLTTTANISTPTLQEVRLYYYGPQ